VKESWSYEIDKIKFEKFWESLMRIFFQIIFGILIFAACKELPKLAVENGRAAIHLVDQKIESYRTVDWHVGAQGRDTISKGILVRVTLPKIDKDSLLQITAPGPKGFGVDGWLMKVSKRTQASYDTLGYLFFPFPQSGDREGISDQISLGTFQVNYHAAAVSDRFSNLNCPAFNHRKKLGDIDIKKNLNVTSSTLILAASEQEVIGSKVIPFSFNTYVFSGGESLVGKYEVSLALFNLKEKTRKSNFINIEQVIDVSTENEILVKGCGSFQVDQLPERESKEKSFNFGK